MEKGNGLRGNNRELMASGDLKVVLPQMAVPTIVAQLITVIYNLVDTFFVSTLGTNATAAVGINNSLERTISLIGMLIGAGACSYISRLLGSKRDEDAHIVMTTSLASGLVLGLIVAIIGCLNVTPLVNFLGATEECRQYSIDYATYLLMAAPFMTGSHILNQTLRSEGSATFAMIGMGFGGVLNCFLDPLFIFTFGLGVKGASMASAISKTISFIILLYPYLRKRTVARLSFKYLKFKMEHVKEVIAIGMSSFMRSLFSVIASVLLNRVAGSYSTSVLAAMSVANRVMQFPFAIILGFGQGVQPVFGYNWGAKNIKRVRDGFNFAQRIAVIGGLIMGVVLIIFANPIIKIFNSAADEAILTYGALTIRLESTALVVHAWGTIVNMFYGGLGKARMALIGSIARQGYCYIPLLLILPPLVGVVGLCGAQAFADLLTLIVFIPMAVRAYKILNEAQAQESPQ